MADDPQFPHLKSTVKPPSQPLDRVKIGVIVTGGVPHPIRGASAVLFFQYIAALSAAGAHLHNLIAVAPSARIDDELREFTKEVGPSERTVTEVVEIGPVLAGSRFSVHDRSASLKPSLEKLSAFAPDALICFDLAAAAVGRFVDCRVKTVWLGDLVFDSQWYNFLYGLRENPATVRHLFYQLAQRARWRELYRDVLKPFEPIIASSYSSVARLTELGLKSRYEPYPWPPLQAAQSEAPAPSKPTFLFFGNLGALGSRSSFNFLIHRLYPRLKQLWGAGGFEIRIAGSGDPRPQTKRLLARMGELRSLGFVEDLAAEIAGCHAVLVPIDAPVGNRSRILTALSCSALVIAHRNAALGNSDLIDGETCFLAADADTFVCHMQHAVDEPASARVIGENGRQMYQGRFSPDVASALFVKILSGRLAR